MSKRKQEMVNSDLTSKHSPTLPLAVAGSGHPEIANEIGGSRHTDRGCRNRDAREKRKETKANSRRAQLTALSKVVNRAFTGWTVKTQG